MNANEIPARDTNLAHQQILFVKVSSIEFRCFAGNRFDFDANFHAFACWRHLLVIDLKWWDDAEVFKLQEELEWIRWAKKCWIFSHKLVLENKKINLCFKKFYVSHRESWVSSVSKSFVRPRRTFFSHSTFREHTRVCCLLCILDDEGGCRGSSTDNLRKFFFFNIREMRVETPRNVKMINLMLCQRRKLRQFFLFTLSRVSDACARFFSRTVTICPDKLERRSSSPFNDYSTNDHLSLLRMLEFECVFSELQMRCIGAAEKCFKITGTRWFVYQLSHLLPLRLSTSLSFVFHS